MAGPVWQDLFIVLFFIYNFIASKLHLQQRFLWAQLEQSRTAFRKNYTNREGKFLSQTLTIPEGALEDLHQRFISLVEELTREMDQKIQFGNEKVAQVNVQLFHPRNWN